MLARFRRVYGLVLEVFVILLLAALAILVVAGFSFRRLGMSLVWYDEVAAVLLAWLTFYGAALAALHRAHMGFPGLVERFSKVPRLAAVLFSEAMVLGFFAVIAWLGWRVLSILVGSGLVSAPWIPVQVIQSAVPIGAVLFVIGQILSFPDVWRAAQAGEKLDDGAH